jgi:hypothetical protein
MKWSQKLQINCEHRILKFKSTFWQHVIIPHFYIAMIKESWTLHIQNFGNNPLQNYNSIIWTLRNDQEIFIKYCNKASTNVINNLYDMCLYQIKHRNLEQFYKYDSFATSRTVCRANTQIDSVHSACALSLWTVIHITYIRKCLIWMFDDS